MYSQPLVSVIIPTYNRADLLGRAIDSVLAQSYENLEVLVCDDGSTDASKALVEAVKDPRVCWVQGRRGGRPAIPRNAGLRLARGEWIAFLDSDDTWENRKLELQLELVKQLGCWASSTNAVRILPEGANCGNYFPHFARNRWNWCELLWCNKVICSSALVHRDIIKQVGIFNEHSDLIAVEDYELWLRVSALTDFAYLNIPLVKYLDAPAQSVRKEQRLGFVRQMVILLRYHETFRRQHELSGLGWRGCLRKLSLKVFRK